MEIPGGPTKDEIMAISLFKLGLCPEDTFADIGCGTGKISLAASYSAQQVYAIDRREEAIAAAREHAEQAGARNITFIHGDAVDFLASADRIDCAFVGGSGNLERVLRQLHTRGTRSIVINAVQIETVHKAISTLQTLGIFKEAIHVQVSRSSTIGGGIMFRPINPVYIICGGSPC